MFQLLFPAANEEQPEPIPEVPRRRGRGRPRVRPYPTAAQRRQGRVQRTPSPAIPVNRPPGMCTCSTLSTKF